MTVIRQDSHSLYAKVGGYIVRPVRTQWVSPLIAEGSEYDVGDHVKTYHRGGTSLATVGVETWCTHGTYHDTAIEDCWEPV